MTEPRAHTIQVPGATLVYDVRRGSDDRAPPLFMLGSPMGAHGFTTLASHFTDRTVITYDPRHSNERSRLADEASTSPPATHADDVRAVIEAAVGDGAVDVLASSGGAINMLAFVAKHPGVVRTLVAHEPPLVSQLPDAATAVPATRAVHETYQREGFGPAMAQFLSLIMHRGEVPAEWAERPPGDPAAFGLPPDDSGARDDPMLGRSNLVDLTLFVPDYAAIRAAATRTVPAVGTESEGEIAHRGGLVLAQHLGVEPAVFPSGHGGFLGGEYGQTGDPEGFARQLRRVLDGG